MCFLGHAEWEVDGIGKRHGLFYLTPYSQVGIKYLISKPLTSANSSLIRSNSQSVMNTCNFKFDSQHSCNRTSTYDFVLWH